MSMENVDLVRSIQPTDVDLVQLFPDDDAAAQAALSGFPDVFAEDFTVRFIAAGGMEPTLYRGVGGLVAGWRDWLEAWASYHLETEEFIDAGDEVVVLVPIRGRTVRSGVTVEHRPAAIWTISEGKVVALRFYLERDEALKAAGLATQAPPQEPSSRRE
jgi:ketosteroid isomerase-like protein